MKMKRMSRFKDGGTTSFLVLDGELKGVTVYQDNRIRSTTKGEFYDRYPGAEGAKILQIKRS